MKRQYKDSGIPWIGMIPSDWRIEQLSGLFSEHKNKNSDLSETNLLSLSYGKIIRKDINTKEGLLPQSFDGYNVIEKGDIVFRLTDLQNDKRSLRTGLCTERGIITSAYVTLRKRQDLDSAFFHYLFHSYDICKVFYGLGDGVRQGMNYSDLRKLAVLFPTLPTQQRIADFLDRKCAEIDELAALQQTMIDELKRYKQSVITEAVTKGLDPNVPMKDSASRAQNGACTNSAEAQPVLERKFKHSGVEWIGEIPEGWEMRAIKTMATLKSGSNITTNDIKEEKIGFPVYGGNGLRGYYSEYSDDGDYALIGRQGALCGNINYAHGKFWATDHCVVCYPKTEFVLTWFGETLRTMNLNQYSLSSAQPGLSVERIKEKLMPVPPLAEQRAIADYLDRKCTEIDELIAIKQQKIEALKEYKKSVIFEYVTGKKEVL